jgi:hypothetical protein
MHMLATLRMTTPLLVLQIMIVAIVAPSTSGQAVQQIRVADIDAKRGALVFSPDGLHFAYETLRGEGSGGERCVVWDGWDGPRYEGLSSLTFSPDSKRLAYHAYHNRHWLTVVDGTPDPDYKGTTAVVFSPDSKHIAYGAWVEPRYDFVLDGHVLGSYDGLGGYDAMSRKDIVAFSPDSRHVVYSPRVPRSV